MAMVDSLEYMGNPLHYLRHFFNIGYYLGVIPFRFKLNENKSYYDIIRNPIQKVLCFIIYGMAVMEELRYIRDLMEEIQKGDGNALNYFKIAYIGSEILCFFTIIITFWFKAVIFKNAVNLLHKKSFESSKSIANASLWTPIALIILFLNTALIFLQTFSQLDWDVNKIGSHWTKNGVRLLFLESILNPEDFSSNIMFSLFFKLLLSISIIALLFVLTLGKILLLNSMFCLNAVVKECKDKVYWRCLSSTDVLIEYKELEEITSSINKAVGLLIFGSIMAMLPYFVTGLVDLMSPDTNIFAFSNHILEITHLFTFLIFSSNINKKASKIEEWILETQDLSHLSYQDFNILIHKISQSNICLDASGFFKVNNSFLGKIIGLLLTFAVIFIQFKTS